MKNQERVWKAEQAAAEEKKRMLELQRERAEERDRAELHDIMNKHSAPAAADNRLAWMYDVCLDYVSTLPRLCVSGYFLW